eukprot:gene31344-6498_t
MGASIGKKTAEATHSPMYWRSAYCIATSAGTYLTGSMAVGERPSASPSQQLPALQLQPPSSRQNSTQAPSSANLTTPDSFPSSKASHLQRNTASRQLPAPKPPLRSAQAATDCLPTPARQLQSKQHQTSSRAQAPSFTNQHSTTPVTQEATCATVVPSVGNIVG